MKRLLIWGTGRLSGEVIDEYVSLDDVIGFIDNKRRDEYMGKKCYIPDEIGELEYDAILIANNYTQEILEQCKELDGVDTSKIIGLYQNVRLDDYNNYDFVESVLGEEYADIIKNRYSLIRGVKAHGDLFLSDSKNQKLSSPYLRTDYVRIKTFELVVKEIRKREVDGAVAELGVFKGEFAQLINAAFPERKLFLFDTFEGFDAQEVLNERRTGSLTRADGFIDAYKETSIDAVLDRMVNLDNIVIKQGLFPESLNGLEERFAFVSLDCDFEESIFSGLEYFYPRLNYGGYIFVHDYSSDLLGVEKAVDRYERLNGNICKVPICDVAGTLVISK